jgi:simple sugar transport system permease protein
VRSLDLRRIGLAVAAPLGAIVFSVLVTSLLMLKVGANPIDAFHSMIDYGLKPNSITNILNNATVYYLSAVAVAIGFRMNLFNIGVDGQYRIAAFFAALAGAYIPLPGFLGTLMVLLVAMLVGAMWAGIAAVLKAKRGVSEVISTIMLNAITTNLVYYLLSKVADKGTSSGNNVSTKPLPEGIRVPGLSLVPGADNQVYGLIVLAVLVGIGYGFLVSRTRFGFDLRATGRSATAAVASGVNVTRMVVLTMLLSGAIAGLVAMPALLGGPEYSYSLNVQTGLGFTGISIALLGRNNPIGIAFAALLWGFLDQTRVILDVNGIPKEVVTIMQGTIVLSVVIAYELARRYGLRLQQRDVGAGTAAPPLPPATAGAAGAGAAA